MVAYPNEQQYAYKTYRLKPKANFSSHDSNNNQNNI